MGITSVGCAGWSIPKQHAAEFPIAGTHLARYSERFEAVEINSSFYRSHRPATYARWAESVSDKFSFAVKVPRKATHELRLENAEEVLEEFLSEVQSLGSKLGPLLVQLPPSLRFSSVTAERFFAVLRDRFTGPVALEPRHPSWFASEAEGLVESFRIARVAADPAIVPAAALPGGWDGFAYYRLHGSPKVYYSAYTPDFLSALAENLSARGTSAPAWCIFDNTALGAATADALTLLAKLRVHLHKREMRHHHE